MDKKEPQLISRPPVVTVVGHIDHGKSTLLDYIRKTNVTEGEAGGITQHLSAYVAHHENAAGKHSITFLDTPGHEAFAAMRSRGLSVADVAILIVSSEDGAKPQTLEALKLIEAAKIPYIVAFTKIDKPGANIERAKSSLLENGIYLEGLGGDVPFVGVSGKSGEGIPELLDLIILAAEIQDLKTNPNALGTGVVIEAHVEAKRGSSATLIIKDGKLKSGEFVVAGSSLAPVRIMEDFAGRAVKEASAGEPVRIVGFSSLPAVGSGFVAIEKKKDAETLSQEAEQKERAQMKRPVQAAVAAGTDADGAEMPDVVVVPLVIKTDASGVADAIEHEIKKLPELARLETRIVLRGVGNVSEADVKTAGSGETPGLVLAFNVKVEPSAKEIAERQGVLIGQFSIIYKMTEWLGVELEKRRPRARMEEKTGSARILKIFSTVKNTIVLGGRVEEGELRQGTELRIMRRDLVLGTGIIQSLQSQKVATKKVEAGVEFGAQLKTDANVSANDRLEAFEIVLK